MKWRTDIFDEKIRHHHFHLSLLQFMKTKFVLLENHMLNRVLLYSSAILKCRPINYNIRAIIREEIVKRTVDNIKEVVQEEEKCDHSSKYHKNPRK